MEQFANMIENIKTKTTLVHFITNYVSVNDCANITLAAGGLPIMSDDIHEVEQMVEKSSALLINIGTLNELTVKSMLAAGKRANRLNIPVILDPVGVGTTRFRNETIETLMRELDFSVIKGNISEIKFLTDAISSPMGVDATGKDIVTEDTLEENVELAQKLSLMAGSVIVITGPIDIIASRKAAYVVRNGNPMMTKVTGTGCMCGAMIACYVGANPKSIFQSASAAVCLMGICGELAYAEMQRTAAGINTYRSLIIDYAGKINAETFIKNQRIVQMSKE